MIRFSQMGRRVVFVGAFAAAVVSCSKAPDAATQTAVDLEPGLYRVAPSGEPPDAVCVRQREGDAFPHRLVEDYYLLHAGCTVGRQPREGNAIGGVITCPADPKLAEGSNRFVYAGVVSADSVIVNVQMKFDAAFKEGAHTEVSAAQMKLAAKALERARIVIEAKRTGECS